MAMYYNGKKVRNLYYNGKCITRLALGKEMTRLVEGDDFVRAEWLCGRNGAYIDTNLVPSQSDHIDCHYRYDGITKNPDGEEQDIFGVYTNLNDGTSYRCRAYINTNNFLSVQFNLANSFPTTGKTITDGNITNLHLNGEKYYFDVNGEHFNFPSNSDTYIERKSIWLFKYNTGGSINRYFHGDIAYFHITDPTSTIDRVNMTPCRLLRPIPAALDGNGIARNADECGMYNLVNGLFYGNVASSGTFTVEPSLVEGVDYEVHQWLCGDGTKYIRIKGYARNEYWTIRTKCRVRGVGGSDSYPQIYGAVYYNGIYGSWALFTSKDVTAIVERMSSLSSYYDNYYNYNYNDVVSIIDEHNNISINNISKSTIADRVYFDNDEFWLFSTFDSRYSTANPNFRIADADISNFTITENGTTVLDLIPCKLLKSIPAKYDANGIARNAGECGMYDAVSGKFYGNVASSGTFTVSDN